MNRSDDWVTAAAVGALAFIGVTLAHEALGHGSVCAALGGHATIHPVSMQCSVTSGWMVAAGPLTNVVLGLALWLLSGVPARLPVRLRFFLWLSMAFHLFNAAGYLVLGAVSGFGDWGVLLGGFGIGVRVALAMAGGLLYYASMHAVARTGRGFLGRRLVVPYLAAGLVSCSAAVLSPLGWSYLWVAAAASVGAGLGLLVIWDWGGGDARWAVSRSRGWIAASVIVSALFVALVGRGLE